MMKIRLVVLGVIVACAARHGGSARAGIVNNSGTAYEDSLTISFQMLDSLGNPVQRASGDSLWLFVFDPGGTLVYVDSARITSDPKVSYRQLTAQSKAMAFLSYKRAVADVDGPGVNGTYKYTLVAVDSSLGLATPINGEFQIWTANDLSAALKRLDSIRLIGTRVYADTKSLDGDTASLEYLKDMADLAYDRVAHLMDVSLERWGGVAPAPLTSGYVQVHVQTMSSSAKSGLSLAPTEHRAIADSLLNRDTAATTFDNLWSVGHTIREIRDTINAHAPHGDNWAATGTGGSGAIPCTLQVAMIVPPDTVALQGVFVRAYNADESATAASGTTDADGRVIFILEAATYHVYGYQAGYIFSPQPTVVVVAVAGANDTLWATPFDPGAPATANLCRVYGWLSDLSGGKLSGATVRARVAESPLRFQNVVISPYERAASTDSTGYWYLDLYPSSALTPGSTRYEFEIRLESGAVLRRRITVPDSSSWLLSW